MAFSVSQPDDSYNQWIRQQNQNTKLAMNRAKT